MAKSGVIVTGALRFVLTSVQLCQGNTKTVNEGYRLHNYLLRNQATLRVAGNYLHGRLCS